MTQEVATTKVRGLLVTGGTSGIGLAIALRLATRRQPVYLLSFDASIVGEKVIAQFRDRGLPDPFLVEADVTNRPQIQAVADDLIRQGIDVGVVVASAGMAVRALALEVEDDAVRRMIDTNLYGLFLTFQAFAPLVLKRPNGRFIAISSVSAIHGQRLRAVYAATKAGVSGLVRGLATEWSPLGATVNAIGPGILKTPLTAAYMESNPEREAAALAHTLVGRLGSVDDVSFTAEYLASEECSFVTGQTIILDGGMSAGSVWW